MKKTIQGGVMSKGKRYDAETKLNIKKVFAVIIAIAVIIMFVIGIKTLLTTDTKEKTTSISSYYPVYTNEKWGVINEKGEIVIEPTYDEMITIPDSKTDVFICMQNVDYDLNKYTVKVLNSKNKEIFTNYDIVEAIENTDSVGNMWYEEGVLKVQKGELYGLIDLTGKEILAPEYDEITPLLGVKNSLLLKKDDQYGLCDNKGNIIVNTEYKEIKGIGDSYKNGYIVINSEDKYGLIDFTSKVILNAEYENIKQVSGNNIYIVKKDGKWQAINSNKEVLVADKFDDVVQIASDKLIIVKNKKYGVISSSGEEIIKPQYDDMSYLFGNYYIAKSKGNYGVVDTSNETVLAFEYSSISYQSDGEFIIADKNGQIEQEVYNNKFEKKLEGIISEVNSRKRLYSYLYRWSI
jgi:hypothetical protein